MWSKYTKYLNKNTVKSSEHKASPFQSRNIKDFCVNHFSAPMVTHSQKPLTGERICLGLHFQRIRIYPSGEAWRQGQELKSQTSRDMELDMGWVCETSGPARLILPPSRPPTVPPAGLHMFKYTGLQRIFLIETTTAFKEN